MASVYGKCAWPASMANAANMANIHSNLSCPVSMSSYMTFLPSNRHLCTLITPLLTTAYSFECRTEFYRLVMSGWSADRAGFTMGEHSDKQAKVKISCEKSTVLKTNLTAWTNSSATRRPPLQAQRLFNISVVDRVDLFVDRKHRCLIWSWSCRTSTWKTFNITDGFYKGL